MRRNHCVTIAISGSTENATIASNQEGINLDTNGFATLYNTILSQNANKDLVRSNPDCTGAGTTKFTSGDYNLIDDATTSELCNNLQAHDITGDPLLGPIGNNGGPTRTRLPAISIPCQCCLTRSF